MKTLKKLTLKDVDIEISIKPEDIHPRNCIAYDTEQENEQAVNDILKRLEYNLWAWCIVCVKVSACDTIEKEYLGACSYEDEQDFKHGGYYDDMVNECLIRLNESLQEQYNRLSELAL